MGKENKEFLIALCIVRYLVAGKGLYATSNTIKDNIRRWEKAGLLKFHTPISSGITEESLRKFIEKYSDEKC